MMYFKAMIANKVVSVEAIYNCAAVIFSTFVLSGFFWLFGLDINFL